MSDTGERIHIVLSQSEKERFRVRAAREGKSLSAWIRDAAREKLRAEEARSRLNSRLRLKQFFDQCDTREVGAEPDWAEHRKVIEDSIGSGRAGS